MPHLIEENLPTWLLKDLGVYLQTCAHIELQVAVIICTVEAKFCVGPLNEKNQFSAVRKLPTGPLINRLISAGNLLPDGPKQTVLEWAKYLEDSLITRHIAVHGAFHVEKQTGNIKVDFFHRNGFGEFEKEGSLVDNALTVSLLSNADESLRASYRLLDLVNSLAQPNG